MTSNSSHITSAYENDKTLEYYVPEDGSNIWYDAWTLPKGSDKELAYLFLDYLSNPVNAADNMDYIGYTPYIVGDELFTLAGAWYGATDFAVNTAYYADDEAMVIYNDELFYCIQDKEADEEIYPTNEEYFESCEYDPEAEYLNITNKCNGNIIDVGSSKEGKLNPFHVYKILTEDGYEASPIVTFNTHLKTLESFFKTYPQAPQAKEAETLALSLY